MKIEHTIDVEYVLCELGVRNVKALGNEVNFSCPEPHHANGDKKPSAYMRQSHPYPFICMGCGAKGTVTTFVANYLGISKSQAWGWLGEKFGFDTNYESEDTLAETLNRILGPKSHVQEQERNNSKIEEPKSFLPVSEIPVALAYLHERGLTDHTISSWKIAWDPASGRIAIPVRDAIGDLIGYKARAIDDRQPKYLVLGDRKDAQYGFTPYNSSYVLFGQHLCVPNAHPLVICEGEFDALACWQAGVQNVVGLPTASMSVYQSSVIRESYENVILFLDSDEAGRKGLNTAINLLQGACNLRIVHGHIKDPMDLTGEEIRAYIANAHDSLTHQLGGYE